MLTLLLALVAADPGPLGPRRGPDGVSVPLDAPKGGVSALVFTSSECPISNAYSPVLNAIVEAGDPSRVRLVGVCVDPDLTDPQIVAHAREYRLKYPVVRDRRGMLAKQLGVTVTPEVVVLDDRGEVRYRGRIDDQYAARQKRNAVKRTDELKDALAAVLAGGVVAVTHAQAVGCPLPKPADAPTYADSVSSILQANCLTCHREGQVGPFPLATFEQARKRSADVARVVEAREMPPWKPDPTFGPRLKHSKALSDADIEAVTAWAEAGAPSGDLATAPAPPSFPEEWALGTPDLVLQPSSSFDIPATGDDVYRCFVIPTDLPKDVYISAIEYRPGNRKVVHHVLSYVDTSKVARRRDQADPGPGYSCFSGPGVEVVGDLGGWAPGNEPSRLPDGVGRLLPRGADVVMQVHYHPGGKPEVDTTQIGLYFSKVPVRQTFHWNAALKLDLKVPAGEENSPAEAHWPVPVDCVALAVTPHMHMIGKDMTISLTLPDGRTQPLNRVTAWDFGWQNTYYFEKPIDVPAGSVLNVVAHFDNSAANPRNPNKPPKEIRWGEATTDEMCIGFIGLVKKGQDLTRPGQVDDLGRIFRDQRAEREAKAGRRR